MTDMQYQATNTWWQRAPLLLLIFIDSLGIGLFYPVLTSLFMDPHSYFDGLRHSMAHREMMYGLVISVFCWCWFFGAAILGDISDRIGRKPVLLICLMGTFVAYVLSALAVSLNQVWLLIVGRMVAGAMAGSQPIAQAAIIDISTPETKSHHMGQILFAASLGFTIGPALGGILSNHAMWSALSWSTPFYVAAMLALLNTWILFFSFHDNFQHHKPVVINFSHALDVFVSAFRSLNIRLLSMVLFAVIFGWSTYYSFIAMFMTTHFQYHALDNAIFLSIIAAGFGVGCGCLAGPLSRFFPAKSLILFCFMITGASIALEVMSAELYLVWVGAALSGISLGVGYAQLLVLFSNQVPKDQQGWVMGVTGSVTAVCFGASTLISGFVASMGTAWPLIMASVALFCGAFIMNGFFSSKRPQDPVWVRR